MIDRTSSMLYHISNLNTENERVSYQMASGKVLDQGSDDAMLHARVISLEDDLRVTEGLKLQIEKTRALNDTADATMGETKIALDSIKIDLMKGLNDGMDRSDKLALATNLRGIRENMIDRVNTEVDGEYLFAGSVTTNQTLVKDADFKLNGQIDFGGDGFLREIAVQPGSYRDRGVTAYDVSFYNASTATADTQFTFTEGERIIDENGNEWKVLDQNGDVYDINDITTVPAVVATSLQQYDHNGKIVDVSAHPDSNILLTSTTAQVEATAGAQAVRGTFTLDVPATPEGRLFEAKHNYFDDLNIVINALEGHLTKLDGTKGNIANEALVDDTLRTGLGQTTDQFDATNIGHGELGGRNAVFEVAYDKILTQETHYNILIQETGGADLAKLAMESKSLEMTYQALYTTISKMNQLSLINFLK
ncbi:MAG: hypothetical protein U9R39_03480 [Campylobacterota bacterium]|nr:hypothetical protein [Campylobacterota bacterium]